MDINEIEKSFNTFEATPEQLLTIIFNKVLRNQALLETILEGQGNMMALVAPGIDMEAIEKQINETIEEKLISIQANVSSRFST